MMCRRADADCDVVACIAEINDSCVNQYAGVIVFCG